MVVNRRAFEPICVIRDRCGREPHQYAGYSGGGKTLAIGCAGEATIAVTHGPRMLDARGRGWAGSTAILPGDRREGARRAGLRFVINVVLDDAGSDLAVAAGEPEAVHDHLVRWTRSLHPQSHTSMTPPGGGGVAERCQPLSGARAASYLHFAPIPPVREGGMIIVPATLPEGAGEGAGEERFYTR